MARCPYCGYVDSINEQCTLCLKRRIKGQAAEIEQLNKRLASQVDHDLERTQKLETEIGRLKIENNALRTCDFSICADCEVVDEARNTIRTQCLTGLIEAINKLKGGG
jgi:hypothetical protein